MGDIGKADEGPRRFGLWAAGLALLGVSLCVPTLDIGLSTDDFVHRSFVTSHLEGRGLGRWWQMFGIPFHHPLQVQTAIYLGFLPWWASLDLSMALFRPLAAASHYLDYVLWPKQPSLMHLQNLLWYGGALAAAAAFYRGMWGRSWITLAALLLYAVDEAHVEGVSWIAGRNTVMTACFALWCLACHQQATHSGKHTLSLVAALLLGLSLLSSEGGIATWAYLLPHALLLDARPMRARIMGLLPAAVVTLLWMGVYTAGGYGMHGTGIYVDPSHPREFLALLPERLSAVLRDQFVLPAIWLDGQPQARVLQLSLLALLFGLLLLGLALPHLRRNRTLSFCLMGSLLAALPLCAIGAAPRLFFLTGLGAFGFMAELADHVGRDLHNRALPKLRSRALAAGLGLLFLLHVPVALALTHRAATRAEHLQQLASTVTAGLPWGRELTDKHLFVLNTPNYFMIVVSRWSLDPPGPKTVQLLSASTAEVRVRRTSETEFEIEPAGGFLLEPWSLMARSPHERFELGYRAGVGPFWVEVNALTDDMRPARLRVAAEHLDDGPYVYCYWDAAENRCKVTALPAVGETLVIPPYPAAADNDALRRAIGGTRDPQ